MRAHEVTFSVPFVAGKERPRHHGKVTYTPAKTRHFEQAIKAAYELAVADKGGTVDGYRAPRHVSVSVTIWTQRPLPKSRAKSISTEEDAYKPDADNVAKLVMDALNGVAWVDDAQVDDQCTHKKYRYRDAPTRTTVHILWGNDWSKR